MVSQRQADISRFFVAGINYKKTDAALRSQYAISNEQYANLLAAARSSGLTELFVLSTCNRTEIYGFAEDAHTLCELLCSQTEGSLETFNDKAYIKKGHKAIEHLFDVAAGLDSQILGDYEIVGQIKTAVKFSKDHGFVDAFLDRLVNSVLQSSKRIKNNTQLSSGTVSVSFAAVQYIREHFTDISGKNILLLGTGKIGRNTCKNLVDYLGTTNITLINRSADKAKELAGELSLRSATIKELSAHVHAADIILVATNSIEPVIFASDIENSGSKLIIDLSIPYNVELSARHLPNITLVNVDDLSKIKDKTLYKRKAEVPKAKAIIAEHITEFKEWFHMRKNIPVLEAVKNKLEAMQTCNLFMNYTAQYTSSTLIQVNNDEKIRKVINITAIKMRRQNQGGCNFIEAINDYMAAANI